MRKQLLLALLMFLPIVACAEEVEIDGLQYNIDNSANTAKVIQYKMNNQKYSGDIVIPDVVTYNNIEYNVISIGERAFQYCIGLTSITIPNSVTSIGDSAFEYCNGLTSFTIPNSVTSIGIWAFYKCNGLTSITIPNSVTSIGDGAFFGCYGLTSIIVASENECYDSRDNCNAIIEKASNTLIVGCMNTTIPNNVTSIGDGAFQYCNGLTSITIPNSVTSIGNGVFLDCFGLTSIIVASENECYDSRDNCNAIIEKASNTLIVGCMNTTIPNNVTSIGDYAFFDCYGLTSINIPNGVTSIGDYAFHHCYGLTSVTIGNSVTSIGSWAFGDCSGLTSINIPNSVTSIGDDAFSGCSGLTSINIPNGVTNIGNQAFQDCSGLTSVTIGNSVTSIGGWAFSNCSGLTSVTIGNSVTSIGGWAFGDCSGLTEVYCYAEKVPSTNTYAFIGTPIDNATLHVPISACEDYRTTEPWSNFGTIIVIPEKCDTPTITYANGKVRFACETEGVEFVPSIMVTPNQLQNGNELAIGGNFTVSVYAVKEGYDNSDTATMTINMSQMGDVNADGELNAADITAVVNAILGK